MSAEITIESRIGSSPRDRGSTGGGTCPDILLLAGGTAAVIGEIPEAFETDQEDPVIVLPSRVAVDALADLLRR